MIVQLENCTAKGKLHVAMLSAILTVARADFLSTSLITSVCVYFKVINVFQSYLFNFSYTPTSKQITALF